MSTEATWSFMLNAILSILLTNHSVALVQLIEYHSALFLDLLVRLMVRLFVCFVGWSLLSIVDDF